MTVRFRSTWALTVVVVLLGALFVAMSATAAHASPAGDSAASIALGELGPSNSPAHPESPNGSGCNKYTGALYGASSGCAAGYGNRGSYGWAWCADFATWVWRQAGADIGGLTSAVSSFTAYGTSHGTYHAAGSGYVPQPGDAAVYGTAHVGVVVSSTKTWPDVVSGNMNVGGSWQVYFDDNSTSNGGGAALTGFVTPVGGSGGGGPRNGQVLGSSCRDVHTGPTGSSPQVACAGNGTTVAIQCVKNGQSVTGPYGTENVWDRVTVDGQMAFISDAWVYTGSNSATAPDCGGNGVVMTPGCQTLYSAPTATSAAVSCVPQAIALTVDCTAAGDPASGPYGTSSLWDHVAYGGSGFMPDAELYTGTGNPVAGTCASIPAPPAVATTALGDARVGQPYQAQLAASGGTGAYSWSVQRDVLPSGLTLAPDGTISGTPDTAGTFTFGVQVADSYALVGTANETIVVAPDAPSVATTTLPVGVTGQTYRSRLQSTGGTGTVHWALVSGSWPEGLSMTAAGLVSGTPTTAGSSRVTVRVTDAAAHSATAAVTLRVVTPLTATAPTLPTGIVGRSYRATLVAAGGLAPRAWTVVAGTLPDGLTLTSTGVVSGVPTTVGNPLLTFRVTDASGQIVSVQSRLRVVAPLAIGSSTLPKATVGSAYAVHLKVTGGASPYVWSLASGAVPPGLSLSDNGIVLGTPTTSGTWAFTVQVSDATGQAKSGRITVTVR